MRTPAEVAIARIEAKKAVALARWEAARTLANSPLMQAVAVWVIVEALQKQGFGSISGTVLEGASVVKMFNVEKFTADLTAIAGAIGPLIKTAPVLAAAV